MSKPTYLYRAILTEEIRREVENLEDGRLVPGILVAPKGVPVGRKTGYLSRSSAVDAAYRNGLTEDQFEIVRSEPVEFLDERGRIEKQIDALYDRLVELEPEPEDEL